MMLEKNRDGACLKWLAMTNISIQERSIRRKEWNLRILFLSPSFSLYVPILISLRFEGMEILRRSVPLLRPMVVTIAIQ